MHDALLLFAAGLLAGAMNALAGGGSFVTLPALIAVGIPSVLANASSTVALYPGGLAAAWTYREPAGVVCGVPVRSLLVVTIIGGFFGALLLLRTPGAAFDLILPWLLLLATLALAFGRRIGVALRGRLRVPLPVMLGVQFLLGVYGGYFGGAVGIMMLAVWSVLGAPDMKALNAPRTLLVSASNTAAVLAFIIAGAVRWQATLVLLLGGVLGGYAGARLGRVLPAPVTRSITLAMTVGITAAFFWRAAHTGG